MQTRGSIMRHWQLVNQMAKTTDTDLVSAFDEGRLSTEDWADMVNACRGCAWAETCEGWLEGHPHEAAAPRPCCNRARFAALREAQEA